MTRNCGLGMFTWKKTIPHLFWILLVWALCLPGCISVEARQKGEPLSWMTPEEVALREGMSSQDAISHQLSQRRVAADDIRPLVTASQPSITAPDVQTSTSLESVSDQPSRCRARAVYVDGAWYIWDATDAGTTGYSKQVCPYDGQPLASCRCVHVHHNLAVWGEITFYDSCQEAERSPVSNQLQYLSTVPVSMSNVHDVARGVVNLTSANVTLVAIDVMYTSLILEQITALPFLDIHVGEAILESVNNILLHADAKVVMEAQRVDRAATRTLEALEAYSQTGDLGETNQTQIVKSQVALHVSDFSETTDVIGFGSITGSDTLTNDSVVFYRRGDSLDTHQSDAAVLLSDEVIHQAKKAHVEWKFLLAQETDPEKISKLMASKIRMKFMIFQTCALYLTENQMDDRHASYLTTNSPLVAASILQVPIRNLHEPIRTIFRPRNDQLSDNICGYWREAPDNSSHGDWSSEGCWENSIVEGRVICNSDHLTNFALLMSIRRDQLPEIHVYILSIISILGLSLSIIGFSLTILTFVLFRGLRESKFDSQRVLVNLSVASLFTNIIFLAGIDQTDNHVGCMVVAALLHYFMFVSFLWMLVEAIVQYYRCVKVFQQEITKNFILKAAILCWGVPLLTVFTLAVYDYELFDDDHPACWLSEEAFLYAFLLPVVIVISINTAVFLIIIKSLYCSGRRPRSLPATRQEDMLAKASGTVGCFVILGLSWAFGLLAVVSTNIAFQYIFVLLTTPQGFFIYILFNFREPAIRKAWRKKLRSMKLLPEPNKVTPRSSVSSSTSVNPHDIMFTMTTASICEKALEVIAEEKSGCDLNKTEVKH